MKCPYCNQNREIRAIPGTARAVVTRNHLGDFVTVRTQSSYEELPCCYYHNKVKAGLMRPSRYYNGQAHKGE